MEGVVSTGKPVAHGGSLATGRYGTQRLGPYLVKSAAVIAILFALSRTLPAVPAWAVGLALAALSLVPAIGSVYRSVVNKTFDYQKKFEEGSIHKGGFLPRVPIFIAFYALSAVSVASILMESPTWGVAMWATVALAVPLYVVVSLWAGWFVEKKEKAIPLVRDARAARFSVAATGALLCIVFTAISFSQHPEAYARAADAFMAAPKPFCVAFALLPLFLAGGVAILDGMVADPAQEGLYQFAKKVVKDQMKLGVYEMDGKYYDPEAVEAILAHAREASESLSADEYEELAIARYCRLPSEGTMNDGGKI